MSQHNTKFQGPFITDTQDNVIMLQRGSSIELNRHKVLSLCLGFARVTDLLRALPVD